MRRTRLIEVGQLVGLAAVYVIAAKYGFRAAFTAEQVSPVWPPTGLALWALLSLGTRLWPAIWLGALIANVTTHVPFIAACGIATGNTLEALLGVWLLRRFGVERTLERLRHVTVLIVGAAMVSTTISATIGVATLCLAGLQPWTRFGLLWSIWWLGDATGALLVAPLLLTTPLWWRAKEYAGRVREMITLEAIVAAVAVVVFIAPLTVFGGRHPLEFAVFPLVIWAGLRFAHPGSALVIATVAFIAVWGTLRGMGPFAAASPTSEQESIILLQIYTAVLSTSGLVLGAAIADRNHSERLRAADHTLTAILAEDHDLQDAAARILGTICETLDWDVGILWRANDDKQVLEYVDNCQRDPRAREFLDVSRATRFQPGIGLPGRVWATAQPTWIHDVVVDTNFPRAPVAARVGLHGAFAFPILLGRKVLGVMEFFSREPRRADASMLTLMAAAGSQIGQFIDRRHAHERVVESDALNAAIVNAALDCVITINGDGRILEFNPAATETFGLSRDQAVGHELAEMIVPHRLRDRHREALRRCVETGEGPILGKRIELPALRADGTEFPAELAVTRVGDGPRPVFTAHIRDITDSKRIEQERSEFLAREQVARMQAENANRSKDQFLATVSHELRTPLTAILGWSSMLKTREFDPDRIAQVYDSIYRNAQVQSQIVNDLLDVSRIVTGQLRLELEPMDISETARLSLETIRPAAVAKGVALESNIPSECTVSGDSARLQQAVWNLLSNAVKFTPAGGTVRLGVAKSVVSVTIEVADTGIGIAPDSLPRVFERFWQADGTPTRTHGGLGLGLALVRHIVELHGGDVQATSGGEGQGSTFRIVLPARVADRLSRPPSTQPIREALQPINGLQNMTALVVDDDAAARELFATILGGEGARVVCAASAAEALESVKREPAQVMIIDIGMPDEDGFALLRRIRAHEAARGWEPAPAIAVTAYAAAADREQALKAGFADHIPKPVLPENLTLAILRAMERRSL